MSEIGERDGFIVECVRDNTFCLKGTLGVIVNDDGSSIPLVKWARVLLHNPAHVGGWGHDTWWSAGANFIIRHDLPRVKFD